MREILIGENLKRLREMRIDSIDGIRVKDVDLKLNSTENLLETGFVHSYVPSLNKPDPFDCSPVVEQLSRRFSSVGYSNAFERLNSFVDRSRRYWWHRRDSMAWFDCSDMDDRHGRSRCDDSMEDVRRDEETTDWNGARTSLCQTGE